MIQRLRNIWRPANFHYHHRLGRGGGQFEGWYFKLVDREGRQPYALIPGVFLGSDAHAFIQVLDGKAGRAFYHRFEMSEFDAASDRFSVRIAGNRFGPEGVTLDIDEGTTTAASSVRGELSFSEFRPWPVTWSSPGVMGPYGFVPFMECNHGILSLDHSIEGHVEVDGLETSYDGGRGYCEKDWGKRFPSAYVWTQSNHFEREGVSLTASVALIPWLLSEFRGVLVGFLIDGRLHRFTTYTGAVIENLTLSDTHLRLRVRNRDLRLELESRKAHGAVLHAPYERKMIERVAETMTSEIELRASSTEGDETIFEGRGRNGCLEMQGELHRILDA